MIYRHTYDLRDTEYSVIPVSDVSYNEIEQDNAVIAYRYDDYVFTMYSEDKSEKYFFGKCMETIVIACRLILSVLEANIAEYRLLEKKMQTADSTVDEDIHMRVLKQHIENNTEKLKEKVILSERMEYALSKHRTGRTASSYRRALSEIRKTASKAGVAGFTDVSEKQTAEEKFRAKKINKQISRLKRRDFRARYSPNKQKQWYRKHQKNILKRGGRENGK